MSRGGEGEDDPSATNKFDRGLKKLYGAYTHPVSWGRLESSYQLIMSLSESSTMAGVSEALFQV